MMHPEVQNAAAASGDATSHRQGKPTRRRIAFITDDLVQAVARQTTPRQRPIEHWIAQRRGSAPSVRGFQAGKLTAKTIQIGSETRHERTAIVLVMF